MDREFLRTPPRAETVIFWITSSSFAMVPSFCCCSQLMIIVRVEISCSVIHWWIERISLNNLPCERAHHVWVSYSRIICFFLQFVLSFWGRQGRRRSFLFVQRSEARFVCVYRCVCVTVCIVNIVRNFRGNVLRGKLLTKLYPHQSNSNFEVESLR